jgi:hypothetical protein
MPTISDALSLGLRMRSMYVRTARMTSHMVRRQTCFGHGVLAAHAACSVRSVPQLLVSLCRCVRPLRRDDCL